MKYSCNVFALIILFAITNNMNLYGQKKNHKTDIYPNIVSVSVSPLETTNGRTFLYRVIVLISEYQSIVVDKVEYLDNEGIKRKVTKQLFVNWDLFPRIDDISLETMNIQVIGWATSNQVKIKLNDFLYLITIPQSLSSLKIKEIEE